MVIRRFAEEETATKICLLEHRLFISLYLNSFLPDRLTRVRIATPTVELAFVIEKVFVIVTDDDPESD